eukprot:scaffold469877_cov18-Prasinocladus_malaysianus.AAC.1
MLQTYIDAENLSIKLALALGSWLLAADSWLLAADFRLSSHVIVLAFESRLLTPGSVHRL